MFYEYTREPFMNRFKLALTLLLALTMAAQAGWDKCRFLFGQAWDGPNATYSSESDFVTIWVGNGGGANNYNTYWEGDMLRRCKSGSLAGKTPVLYSYIAAELAKVRGGLKDCDVAGQGSSVSLCTQGAVFLRNNRALILQKYQEFAQGVARDWGTTQPVVWLMEPDFFQYTEASSYWGTMQQPLSQAEAGSLMTEMVARVKAALPNAVVSMDISPWMGGSNWSSAQTVWWNALPKSAFSYRNTSGGRTQGASDRIRSDAGNLATWAGISQLSGTGIIADDGYGVAGAVNGDWTEWMSASNLNARIAGGVVALHIPKPGDWTNQIKTLRSQLSKPTTCGPADPISYSLTLSATSNGTIAASPVAPTGGYPAGTMVTLAATAATGYQLTGWTGACSGTGACSVTMNGNQTVGANFATTPPPKTNKVLNGDFAVGTTSWSFGVYGGSAVGAVAGGEYVTTPTSAGSQPWHFQLTQGNIKLEQGKSYVFGFRARASNPRSVGANVGMSANPYTSFSGSFDVALTTGMQTFTKTFVHSGATTTSARVEFNSGLNATKWVLDDVTLVEAVAPTPQFAPRSLAPDSDGSAQSRSRALAGESISFDASGLGESILEVRSLDGSKRLTLWSGTADGVLSIPADRIPRGLWIATLRGRNGSRGQILNLLR